MNGRQSPHFVVVWQFLIARSQPRLTAVNIPKEILPAKREGGSVGIRPDGLPDFGLPNGAWLFFSPAKLVRPSAKRPTYTFRTNNIIIILYVSCAYSQNVEP